MTDPELNALSVLAYGEITAMDHANQEAVSNGYARPYSEVEIINNPAMHALAEELRRRSIVS